MEILELKKIRTMLEEARHRTASRSPREADDPPAGSQAVYEVDLNKFKLIRVDDFMCQVMGYTEDELLAMNPLLFLVPEDRGKLIDRTMKILAGKPVPDSVEYRVLTKKGRMLRAVMTTEVIRENGIPVRVRVTAREAEGDQAQPAH